MAEPTDSYPEDATLGAHGDREAGGVDSRAAGADGEPADVDGDAALRAVLDVHGDDLAAAIDRTDEAADVLETAILVLASASDEEIDHLTESVGNLVDAADGLSTEGTVELATGVGANGDELAEALDTVVELQRLGHLDDLATIASAVPESLSSADVEELASLVEENGSETVASLDVLLELQRQNHLEDLVALAGVLSSLEIDADTAAGLNTVLGAVGEAQRKAEPVGPLGFVAGLRSRDARAGLGYLLTLLKAQGRRLRQR